MFQGLDEFVSRNARTAVFVISAFLTKERIEKLTQKGIPENHIFHKGQWARSRGEFHKKLQEAISDFEEVARKNMVMQRSKLVAMIKTYQDLPRNWNSFDRDPPSELARSNAIKALHNIFEALPDRIDPSNDESIIFTYYRDDWYYLIEFYNDGEIAFLKRKGSEPSHVEDVTLADLDRVLKEINDGYGK